MLDQIPVMFQGIMNVMHRMILKSTAMLQYTESTSEKLNVENVMEVDVFRIIKCVSYNSWQGHHHHISPSHYIVHCTLTQ
jgi:hypothetical protein